MALALKLPIRLEAWSRFRAGMTLVKRAALARPLKSSLVLLTFLPIMCPTAQAVPSFTRETGLKCSVCHSNPPELTAFGRKFKLEGYTLTDKKPDTIIDDNDLKLSRYVPICVMSATAAGRGPSWHGMAVGLSVIDTARDRAALGQNRLARPGACTAGAHCRLAAMYRGPMVLASAGALWMGAGERADPCARAYLLFPHLSDVLVVGSRTTEPAALGLWDRLVVRGHIRRAEWIARSVTDIRRAPPVCSLSADHCLVGTDSA